MQDMNVALIQTSLFWEAYELNLRMLDQKFNSIKKEVNLIILPEMFSSGFSMNYSLLAQNMDGPIINWLLAKAKKMTVDIVGSLIIKEDGRYYNRLVWVKPNGNLYYYDKKHLFSYAGEDKVYTQGEKRLIVECCGWKVCPLICYDLRFPIWSRNLNNEYDLIIFVANWPETRSHSWKTLLVARAIENQSYSIGVNRVGQDGNGIKYTGDSSVIDPMGKLLCFASLEETIIICSLSYSKLEKIRSDFPFWKDADR